MKKPTKSIITNQITNNLRLTKHDSEDKTFKSIKRKYFDRKSEKRADREREGKEIEVDREGEIEKKKKKK